MFLYRTELELRADRLCEARLAPEPQLCAVEVGAVNITFRVWKNRGAEWQSRLLLNGQNVGSQVLKRMVAVFVEAAECGPGE